MRKGLWGREWGFGRFARKFDHEINGSKLYKRWLTQLSENPVEGVCGQSTGRSLFAKQETIFLSAVVSNEFFFSWSIHFKELQRKESLFDCPQIWTVTRLTYVSGNCLFRNITSPRAIFARSLHITSCYFEIKIFCNFLLQLTMAKRRQLFLALSVLKPRKQTNWRKTKFALTCSFQKMIRALVFSCFETFGNLFSTFGVLRNYIFWDVG